MTLWQIALVVSITLLLLLEVDRWWIQRKQRRLITEEKNRRWYPTMRAIERNSRGKWDGKWS